MVNGTISDGGAGLGINTTGSGAVVLAAANTYSGPTTVSAGTVTLAHPLAVQYSTVNVGGSGTLGFAGGIVSPILGGLAGNGNIALTTAAAEAVTLNVGSNGQSTTYNGSLTGFGSLVKQGAGTLTLTNTNGYGGATLISGGVLQLASQNQSISAQLPVTTGLSYWLNATSGTIASLANGAAVTSWADESGNGVNFTGTASYATGAINGLGCVFQRIEQQPCGRYFKFRTNGVRREPAERLQAVRFLSLGSEQRRSGHSY